MTIFRRRRALTPGVPSPVPSSAPSCVDRDPDPPVDVVVVSVSAALGGHMSDLTAALGSGFDVRLGPPQGRGVALVSPQGTTALAFYRLRHPRTALLVVGPGRDMGGQGPVDYLNAGADGYVAALPTCVLAAYVRTLARRQAPAQTPPPLHQVAV